MSLPPVGSMTGVFQRKDLEKLVGINPATRATLEGLPEERDVLVIAINETRDGVNVIAGAPLVVWDAPPAELTDTRRLADSADIAITITADEVSGELTDTAVTAGTYGAADKLVGLTVDVKGRLTDAEEFDLESGNVTETSNLFFTDQRARDAVSVPVPPTASSPGIKGQIASAPGFFYHCVAANTWERVATATF